MKGPIFLFVDRWLNNMRVLLERYEQPGFFPLIRWFEERRSSVPCPHPSVLHWDFHPSNILIRTDSSPVVIDWTGLRVSDARFDLAWTLLLARSYLGQAWRDRILSEYERLLGSRVEEITFFELCACIRRLFDVVFSISQGAEKLGLRQGAEYPCHPSNRRMQTEDRYVYIIETGATGRGKSDG